MGSALFRNSACAKELAGFTRNRTECQLPPSDREATKESCKRNVGDFLAGVHAILGEGRTNWAVLNGGLANPIHNPYREATTKGTPGATQGKDVFEQPRQIQSHVSSMISSVDRTPPHSALLP